LKQSFSEATGESLWKGLIQYLPPGDALDSVPRYGLYSVLGRSSDGETHDSRLTQLGRVNLETIRRYERRGLLAKPPRTEAGYRQFSPDTAQRLRFIKRAQELGFTLDEVGELLGLRHDPQHNPDDVRTRATEENRRHRAKIETLAAMKSVLVLLTERCEQCGSDSCPILASLEQEPSV